MNNSLVTLCIVFSLFYLSSSISLLTYQQIVGELRELRNLTTFFAREEHHNSSLVPKIGEMKNVSDAEISCRAIKSLKHARHSERKHFHDLERYLAFVMKQGRNNQVVKCDISVDEQEDLYSFITSLLEYFRKRMFN